ncbi:MAG: AAA family ATPase [Motilibacteraceae bacterium]
MSDDESATATAEQGQHPLAGLAAPDTGPVGSRPRLEDRPTRPKLALWDRTKLLLLLAVVVGVLWWYEYDQSLGLESPVAALPATATTYWWLLLLAGLEVLRQLHFLVAERSARYHRRWNRLFAGTDRLTHRIDDWNRYRLARALKLALFVVLLAVVLGKATHQSPVRALFSLPTKVYSALPLAFQLAFALLFGILQFAGIFWFLSRGGVETYMPDDIRTRFTDVWGQDRVLEKVRENVVFLEDPEKIEAAGGYVPSGILLWGPPGTGKTLMAEAMAGETGKPYVFVDPGAFINMFFGVGVLKVKGLFRKLRKLALRYGGVIVFFDEADTLGSRGGAVANARKVAAAMGSPAPWVDEHACGGRGYVSAPTRDFLTRQEMARAEAEFVMPGGMNGGRGSFDGTLQALLTELSGLKKPRGFLNRSLRKVLGMRPKPPPKYRILVVMATNMPDSLDPALLRPGRIDRIYRVGYPTKEGRVVTYRNYLDRVDHDLTEAQIERLATITPYATGATIKDVVNEALITAMRDGRHTVTYADVLRARSLKEHGLADGFSYVDRERHSVALHEACHAVVMYRLQKSSIIDTATIERRGDTGGFVSPIPVEERFVEWRSEVEVDVMTFLASLAGERLFYDGDHTQGVGGDMANATAIVTRAFLSHAMGSTLRAHNMGVQLRSGVDLGDLPYDSATGEAIEAKLRELYDRTSEILRANRREVLAVTHALETQLTLSGEDVVAVIEGTQGPAVDGARYVDPAFVAELEDYHRAAVAVHQARHERPSPLPQLPGQGQVAASRPVVA